MSDAAVRLENVSYAAGVVPILSGIDLAFRRGSFTVVLGPNGAGKSTLMRIASGRLAPKAGRVLLDGEPVAAIAPDTLARRRAVLSQNAELAFPLPVEDVVMMGRYPYYRGAPSPRDRAIVAEALALVDMTAHRHQPYPTLSGGERQKTHLARVLAQIWEGEDRILFLDEPTTSLDIHYQLQLLETARGFLARGCTIIASLHDLNMALATGDNFVLLDRGAIAFAADSAAALPREIIERVYRVKAEGETGAWRFRL